MHTNKISLALLAALLLPLTACAQPPNRVYLAYDTPPPAGAHRWVPADHPYYLHAMSDLRLARAYLARRGNQDVNDDERAALGAIDAALREMWQAALSDGKNPDWQAPIDASLRGADRFHMARQLLDKAHQDASHEEDDPWVRELQGRILRHIDEARHATEHAWRDAGQAAPPPQWRPQEHPYYLHAMSDLRAARAYLTHSGTDAVQRDELNAIGEIDAALGEMWHAAISDGKDPRWQMPVDERDHGPDRYHRALQLLEQARRDASHAESDPWTRGLQARIQQHIAAAQRLATQAYHDALR